MECVEVEVKVECVEVECGVCRWRSVCRVECVEMEGGMWECVEGGVWSVWRCVVSGSWRWSVWRQMLITWRCGRIGCVRSV